MNHVFWLVPGKLAGRPGPDKAPWDLAAMRGAGIGAILSVNDGLLCHPEDFAAAGLVYACIPFTDSAPPQPGDDVTCLRVLRAAHAFVEDQLAAGRATVVHCTSGKDRTGLLLGYHLVRRAGLTAAEAIEEVRRVRPIALSAPGWLGFAAEVLERVT
jgi:protein-tyrosine phosphatase